MSCFSSSPQFSHLYNRHNTDLPSKGHVRLKVPWGHCFPSPLDEVYLAVSTLIHWVCTSIKYWGSQVPSGHLLTCQHRGNEQPGIRLLAVPTLGLCSRLYLSWILGYTCAHPVSGFSLTFNLKETSGHLKISPMICPHLDNSGAGGQALWDPPWTGVLSLHSLGHSKPGAITCCRQSN